MLSESWIPPTLTAGCGKFLHKSVQELHQHISSGTDRCLSHFPHNYSPETLHSHLLFYVVSCDRIIAKNTKKKIKRNFTIIFLRLLSPQAKSERLDLFPASQHKLRNTPIIAKFVLYRLYLSGICTH